MKPSIIGVDYLAYEWQPSELIACHREMRHKMTELSAKIRCPNDKRTCKMLDSDYARLTRCQNAVWRQMANRCTDVLGSKNPLLDPATLLWDKEADCNWLYGPLYNNKITVFRSRPTNGLKSALKTPRTSSKPFFKFTNNYNYNYNNNSKINLSNSSSTSTSSSTSSSSSSSSSSNSSSNRSIKSTVSVKSSQGLHVRSPNEVRFDPEIRRILYQSDLPPTHDSLLTEKIRVKTLDDYCAEMDANTQFDDDCDGGIDTDDLVYECTLWVRQKILSLHFLASHRSRIDSVPCARPRDLVVLIIRILQSMVAATTMWMVYQSLLPVRWLIRPAKKSPASKMNNKSIQ
ncbi:hypothetical protein PHYBLDRAFT_59452 [Phycomyces blakesleeanus NRRL 1555(-)]|uniref:Uncharacterized protein n=1 Tax=Phycomyces blakesleeanus (strain ATCC 8743b / DSM 1359 / FGSC 10004 / NBRC 33097 / NRRL 1555) TaxID=763407 RepID=A0A162UKA4_PHYB8|nr:hypothetical protein PHYBLDRAFT_59452 [Phycomyces blakesleeanus NRRL 1555(-)]OAD75923.1 hypothetical protein PHYBLDRAFT_59452 [Phycomyces blakesleeanus NRRL 1555(-)]|eukprot:XP_018293963.1 hypothetical protein PHYBLDRAFT_59452 [Phycomyces blakesleeanus NRRL 1555(-)]